MEALPVFIIYDAWKTQMMLRDQIYLFWRALEKHMKDGCFQRYFGFFIKQFDDFLDGISQNKKKI